MIGLAGNFRTVMTGPISDSGSMMALTREPSGSRASTRGLDCVDPPAERGDDPVDDPQDVLVVEEDGVDPQDLAAPLDVEVVRAVDHDLGDRLVGEQRLERPEAADLADELVDQARALVAGDGEAVGGDDPVDDPLDPGPQLGRVGDVEERAECALVTSSWRRSRIWRSSSSRAATRAGVGGGGGVGRFDRNRVRAGAGCCARSTRWSSDMTDASPRARAT